MSAVALLLLMPIAAGQVPTAEGSAAEGSAAEGGAADGDTAPLPEGTVAELQIVYELQPATLGGRRLDAGQLRAWPGRSTEDLLRATPGLHLSTHGGAGKAGQFLLRGVDAQHGAELAVTVDGVPWNEPSHAHGHGYLDLYAIPRGLVRAAALQPGPFDPRAGDFATAGSVALALGVAQQGGLAQLGGGTDRGGVAALALRPAGRGPGSFALAEVEGGLGVGEGRGFRHLRAAGGLDGRVGGARARAWVLLHDGRFDNPGVLPDAAWRSGEVGLYEALPGAGGGRSSRAVAAARLEGERAGGGLWVDLRRWSLTQNYTGFWTDPAHGDGLGQAHGAARVGGDAALRRPLGARLGLQAGASGRVERAIAEAGPVSLGGAPLRAPDIRAGQIGDAGAWAALGWLPTPALLVEPALRAQAFVLAPDDGVAGHAAALAPRLRARLDGGPRGALSIAAGRGLRSPELPQAGGGATLPVARVDAAELAGERALGPARLHVAAWASRASDELVYDHSTATTLSSGPTRRVGADLGAQLGAGPGPTVGVDLSLADGRFTATGAPIPYAPRVLAALHLGLIDQPLGRARLSGGLRTWALGRRALPGGFTSHRSTATSLRSTVEIDPLVFTLDVDNLFFTPYRDGEFMYPSDWTPGAPRAELPVRHLTAGAPFAARATAGVRW